MSNAGQGLKDLFYRSTEHGSCVLEKWAGPSEYRVWKDGKVIGEVKKVNKWHFRRPGATDLDMALAKVPTLKAALSILVLESYRSEA